MRRHILARYPAGPYVVTHETINGSSSWRVCKATTGGALRVEWPQTFANLPAAFRAIERYTGRVVSWQLAERPPPPADRERPDRGNPAGPFRMSR